MRAAIWGLAARDWTTPLKRTESSVVEPKSYRYRKVSPVEPKTSQRALEGGGAIPVGQRFYWFDCGVLNAIRGELAAPPSESSSRSGNLFETWVILETIRLNDYSETDYRFHYWRTNSGMEVDLVLSRDATHAEKASRSSLQPLLLWKTCVAFARFSPRIPGPSFGACAELRAPIRPGASHFFHGRTLWQNFSLFHS